MQKQKVRPLRLVTCALVGLSFSEAGWSQQAPPTPGGNQTAPPTQAHLLHNKKVFLLGVCVGQTLLMQDQPTMVTPGQQPSSSVASSMKAAIQACRAQMGNNGATVPTPNVGATPTAPSTPAPTPLPPAS